MGGGGIVMPSPITALGNNNFVIRVRLGKDENGKLITRSETHHCPRGINEAYEILGKLKEKFKNKKAKKKPKSLTLKELISIWNCEYSEIRHGDAAIEQSGYLQKRIVSALGHKKLSSITSSNLNTFTKDLANVISNRTKKPLSTETVHKHQALLRQLFKYARRNGYIELDPSENMTMVKVIKDKDREKLLTLDEMALLSEEIKKASLTNQAAFCLLVELGLRREEVCALTWDNIDFKKQKIKINQAIIRASKLKKGYIAPTKLKDTKNTSSERELPISSVALKLLIRLKENNNKLQDYYRTLPRYGEANADFVFISNKTGYAISPDSLSQWIRRISKRLSITKTSSHKIRHWFATIMAERKVNPKITQQLLGHSKIETTLKYYTHVSDQTKQNVCKEMSDFVQSIVTGN